jgi:hypothetical protein
MPGWAASIRVFGMVQVLARTARTLPGGTSASTAMPMLASDDPHVRLLPVCTHASLWVVAAVIS